MITAEFSDWIWTQFQIRFVSCLICAQQCSYKEIGDKEPYYSTKISILFFIWAGLVANTQNKHNIMKVVQS